MYVLFYFLRKNKYFMLHALCNNKRVSKVCVWGRPDIPVVAYDTGNLASFDENCCTGGVNQMFFIISIFCIVKSYL